MLTIRFARVGRKNKAQYKIVLQEHTVAPSGHHVEILGSYDPHSKNAIIKEDRVKYWIEKGAQSSDTAHNLFVSKGIVTGDKRKVKVSVKKDQKETPDSEAPETKTETTETKETPKEAKKEEPKEEKKEEVKKEEAPKAQDK